MVGIVREIGTIRDEHARLVARAGPDGAAGLLVADVMRLTAAVAARTADAFARTPSLSKVKLKLPVVAGLPRPTFELAHDDTPWDAGEFWRLIASAYRAG